MRVCEFTEDGFDGSTDATDDKVHWIAAPDEDTAMAIGDGLGWVYKQTLHYAGGHDPGALMLGGVDIVCGLERRFTNKYRHCKIEWDDEWSCACNDECPQCGAEIEPYDSIEHWEAG
jgi:hypothetical protein